MQIFILEGEEQKGPFSAEELRLKIQRGECTSETLAWHEGLAEWLPLSGALPKATATPSEAMPPPELEASQATPPSRYSKEADRKLAIALGVTVVVLSFFGSAIMRLIPLLLIGAGVLMWVKKWFSPRVRFAVTGGALFFTLIALGVEAISRYEPARPAYAGTQAPSDTALTKLQEIGPGAFGAYRFDNITMRESFGNNSDKLLKEAQINIKEAVTDAKPVCRGLIAFFREASSQNALGGIEYFKFKFHGTLVFDDGRKEEAQLLGIGFSREKVARVQWENMEPDMLIRLLRQKDADLWFHSSLNWSRKGW